MFLEQLNKLIKNKISSFVYYDVSDKTELMDYIKTLDDCDVVEDDDFEDVPQNKNNKSTVVLFAKDDEEDEVKDSRFHAIGDYSIAKVVYSKRYAEVYDCVICAAPCSINDMDTSGVKQDIGNILLFLS